MTNMVGSGFEAYARLLHPLTDEPGGPTWAEVARANGRIMHPSAQWNKINAAPGPLSADNVNNGRVHSANPHEGNLNAWALEALCAVLAGHTATPQTCYFAVWEGRGALDERSSPGSSITSYRGPGPKPQPPGPAPAEWKLDLTGPRFPMPLRDSFYLFEGHVGEAVRIGRWSDETWFLPKSPHFFWPADHAWCVGTEVDFDSTFIGGSRDLVNELCASEVLEVLRIAPDAPYDDHLNAE
jgi:hypothetical protein